jgi:hypothetical protein
MRRSRISIAALLAGIALFGVAFTALIHPSPLWGDAFYSMTLATLTIAVLAAVYGQGPRRAFWVGFSTCGWAYFLAIFGPEPLSHFGSNLITTAILDIIYPYTIPRIGGGAALIPAPSDLPEAPSRLARRSGGGGMIILAGAFAGAAGPPIPPPTPWEIWTKPDRATRFNQASPRMYRRIGHSMACLIFALIGGILARRFREKRESEETG